jgi:dipeptidyl aminopeptidase/acylaminoacyl peptidase
LYYLKSLARSTPEGAQKQSYPPTYLLTGTNDDTFAPIHHSVPFYDELVRQNITAKLDLQPGLGHAFDVWAGIGSDIGEEILKPAVQWCTQWTH